jgi:tetratricopeptide (TPR) repeat protein
MKPSRKPRPPERKREWNWGAQSWRLGSLWLLLLAAYSNSFQAGLVFDNAKAIAADPRIREATAHNAGLILTQDYWYNRDTSGLYRPITTLSYLANYALLGNGVRPEGYHWVNLVLHCANAGLVYALGMIVFEEAALALALAALWGLHPLLTESVTNVVGRADLLAGFGVLAGLICYVKSQEAARRKFAWLAAMAAAQTIGLLSKENAAVLPAVMLLYDLVWRKRVRWPGYASLLPAFAVYAALRSKVHTHIVPNFAENPLVGAGFWTARITALKVLGKYLWLFIWPAQLSADYSFNAVPLFGWRWDADGAQAMLALAAIAGLAFSIFKNRRTPAVLFFAGFFAVAIAPVSNLIILIGSIMAERFLYLPAVGLAGCAVLAIRALAGRWQWIAVALLCLALGARTYARNADWHDELSLWTSAVAAYPASARPHNNLANALAQLPGRLPDAVSEYEAALHIRPDDANIHYNLGNALAQMPQRLPDAIAQYRAALRIDPAYVRAHINLANALARNNAGFSEAVAEYDAALRLEPGNADAHYNLANLLARTPARLPDAIREYRAALAADPDKAEAHNNLGSALAHMQGRAGEAVAEYAAAARLEPGNPQVHYNLGNLLANTPGRLAEAIAEYRAALAADPANAAAHNNLASALAQTPGGLPEAIAEYQAAVRIDPGNAALHYNLGNALAQMPGRKTEAVSEYETGLRIAPDPDARQALEQLLRATSPPSSGSPHR